MDKNRLTYLLKQYADNIASVEEVKELFAYINTTDAETLQELLMSAETTSHETHGDLEHLWLAIEAETTKKKKYQSKHSAWWRYAAAALVLFTVSGSYFFFAKHNSNRQTITASQKQGQYKNDITPGGNKATLTLADGSVIVLDSAQNGSLAQQGNTKIIKLNAGQLAYNNADANGKIMYNTITTPRGGQYQVMLPDGTKVWMNAESSLYFPTAFTGNERRVELTGEAYFEVAHLSLSNGKKMPFIVHVNSPVSATGMDVLVTGTHFDIMAYGNEQNIKTTLLEGSVKILEGNTTKDLMPGKQAIVSNDNIKIADANTEQAIAWKDGYFRFKETGIKEIMRQVERWYDVDVAYQTQGELQDYTGVVPRSENVSALLHTLELTGTVHFKIEGRKIIVLQ